MERIDIEEGMRERGNSCHISISAKDVSIYWDRPLEDGPHKATMTERMAAGALLGIARALSGKAEEDVVKAIASVNGRKKR